MDRSGPRLGIGLVLVAVAVASTAACGAQKRAAGLETGLARFQDPGVGLSGRYPEGWDRRRALTSLIEPREVLALGSYPLRGGNEAGECAPNTALADMPPDGALVWLVEFRPLRGEVWADFPRSRFPVKPRRFDLHRSRFRSDLYCHGGPGYETTFRAADRPSTSFSHSASE